MGTNRWRSSAGVRITAIGLATLITAGCSTAMGSAGGSTAPAAGQGDCGRDRIVVVGMSSSERSPSFVAFAESVATTVTQRAMVCGDSFAVLGVAGGTSNLLLGPEHVSSFEVDRRPNERARERRVRTHTAEIDALVRERFDEVLVELEGAQGSSVLAMYRTVVERARPGAAVTIVTDGVHIDDSIDLNRPLEPGEGAALAAGLPVAELPGDVDVTLAGLAQVDAEVPVPGNTWPEEIVAFNQALCGASGASCRAFTVASVTEVVH